MDQRAALDRFLHRESQTTSAIETACVEITESKFDRVLFSVIDTPGLDFVEGRELKLERQVNGIIRYIDAQYADTMSEASHALPNMSLLLSLLIPHTGVESHSKVKRRPAHSSVCHIHLISNVITLILVLDVYTWSTRIP